MALIECRQFLNYMYIYTYIILFLSMIVIDTAVVITLSSKAAGVDSHH